MIDNAYHDIYIAEAQTQIPARSVYAALDRFVHDQDVEDTAVVVLKHENGATSVIEASWAVDSGAAAVDEVHGTAGSIRIPQAPYSLTRAWLSADLSQVEREVAALAGRSEPAAEIYQNPQGEWTALKESDPGGGLTDGIHGLLAATFTVWQHDQRSPCGWPEARHNMAVLTAAYAAAERGEVVTVSEFDNSRRAVTVEAARQSEAEPRSGFRLSVGGTLLSV